MTDQKQANDGSQPGVMGDWTEEQNLGQKGHPEDRIKKGDVEAAFGADREGKSRDQAKDGDGQADRSDAGSSPDSRPQPSGG